MHNVAFFQSRQNVGYLKQCDKEILTQFNIRPTPSFSYYCINLNNHLIGQFDFSFTNCNKIPDSDIIDNKIICTKSNSTTRMKSTRMFMYLPELGFNPELEYPFIERMAYRPLIFNNIFKTFVNVPLTLQYLNDDIGWISKNYQNKMDIDMSVLESEYILDEEESNVPQVSFTLRVGSKFRRYTRSYVKFQEFLAIIGGFMKFILSVLNVGLLLVKTYLIDLHIMSTQFNDKEKLDKISQIDGTVYASNQSKLTFKKELINNFVELKIAPTKEENGNKPSKIKIIKSNINIAKYTKAALLNMFNCKSSGKSNSETDILRKKLNAVDKLQDYDMILKKINELEVMKKMLFSDTQLLCFDFLDKPNCITTEDNALSRSLSLLVTQVDQKRDNLVNNFSKLISESTLDGMDEKFFRMLSDDVKQDIFRKIVK
jgi:hypothetical protein